MERAEALSTAAQIAVALAGVAGVVVAFRRESIHEWSPINKFRLRLLLANSILPLRRRCSCITSPCLARFGHSSLGSVFSWLLAAFQFARMILLPR
jgi:hypothetical protein